MLASMKYSATTLKTCLHWILPCTRTQDRPDAKHTFLLPFYYINSIIFVGIYIIDSRVSSLIRPLNLCV